MKGTSRSKHTVTYIKWGDMETALKDFYSIKPQAIREPSSGYFTTKVGYSI